ncbi:MAG: endonuclease Q family protein [Candidatus Omnitrophica bacterium]|nr:endonuclease Q family protein [Candidatus Omnitrophota bacterium]
MKFVADLHIHSKYSRATSRDMDIPNLTRWAKLKGVGLLATGDFTHHLWLQELKQYLKPLPGKGLYVYDDITFILSAEISSIFSQNGKTYRVHNLILAPSLEIVEEVNRMLSFHGNIASDGRPILGMSCYFLAQELFKISQELMLIPAHVWTPWFSVFGSQSGFDSLQEAFGEYTDKITALETGLSSDPAMNWMISGLDKFSLVSNSDSHSPSRIGREANIFDCELDYWEIKRVLEEKDKSKFLYTIEFFPEEGKYHYDGHRKCQACLRPEETRKRQGLCPVCGRPITKGVLYRVEELADRPYGFCPDSAIDYKSLVPLDEIIAEVKGVGKTSKAVEKAYLDLVQSFGPELYILAEMPVQELMEKLPESIGQGIVNVREKKIKALPGYDGEYGKIKVFSPDKERRNAGQLKLF